MATDIEKAEKHKLLHVAEISLMLDKYDDIYSDFDPRPYTERAVSYDFLDEMKRASRDMPSGKIELKLMIPKHARSFAKENFIRKRLHAHFKKHHQRLHDEINKLRITGLLIAVIGFTLMGTALFITDLNLSARMARLVLVVIEPSGWFAMWFGFDKIFYSVGEKKSDMDFYDKMSKCEITFTPY